MSKVTATLARPASTASSAPCLVTRRAACGGSSRSSDRRCRGPWRRLPHSYSSLRPRRRPSIAWTRTRPGRGSSARCASGHGLPDRRPRGSSQRSSRPSCPAGRSRPCPAGSRNVVGVVPGPRPVADGRRRRALRHEGPARLRRRERRRGRHGARRRAGAQHRAAVSFAPRSSSSSSTARSRRTTTGDFYETGLRGSKSGCSAVQERRGDDPARLRRRSRSLAAAGGLLGSRLSGGGCGAAARKRVRHGTTCPVPRPGPSTSRESPTTHLPFQIDPRAGVPSIRPRPLDRASISTAPCWHRTCDNLSRVSKRSLDAVGETVYELLRQSF